MDNTTTVTMKMNNPKYTLSIGCLICSECIPLTTEEILKLEHGMNIHSKVCDKCKRAILHIRKETDKEE